MVGCVPVPNARPGSMRTTTASGSLDLLVMRADPESLAEAHGVEVAQPFALPDAILDASDSMSSRAQARGTRPACAPGSSACVDVRKQRLQPCRRPQPELARQRLEHRPVTAWLPANAR